MCPGGPPPAPTPDASATPPLDSTPRPPTSPAREMRDPWTIIRMATTLTCETMDAPGNDNSWEERTQGNIRIAARTRQQGSVRRWPVPAAAGIVCPRRTHGEFIQGKGDRA